MMINVNKKLILFFAMASITHGVKSQTIVFPRELFQEQNVSLFLLVQDINGTHRGGVFEIDQENPAHTINTEDLKSVDDATLALEGEEVKVVESCDVSTMNQNFIYFEIADDVTVIKALLINNSLLAEHVISVVDVSLDDVTDESFESFDFEDCGFGDAAQQKEMIATKGKAPSKHFSPYQWYALAKIVVFVGIGKAKNACVAISTHTQQALAWLTQYNKKTL